jgi:hypothetical protein
MRRGTFLSGGLLFAVGTVLGLMANDDQVTVSAAGCRFYGPDRAVFDKTWKLPDIEKARWTLFTTFSGQRKDATSCECERVWPAVALRGWKSRGEDGDQHALLFSGIGTQAGDRTTVGSFLLEG